MSAKSNRINYNPVAETSVFSKNEVKHKFSIFDNINVNNLGSFYNKDESYFKKKVDKLNLRFYLETDKYLNFKNEMEKSQDHLFLLLFKQISVYVEEIERLNLKVKEKEENDKFHKIRLDEIGKREALEKEIVSYKTTLRNLEKKVFEGNQNEEKLKKENESYRRQIMFYKDKLKLELSDKKNNFNNNILNFNLITTPNEATRKIINSNLHKGKNEEEGEEINNYFSIEKVDQMKENKSMTKVTYKFNGNDKNEIHKNLLTDSNIRNKRLISTNEKNKFINDEKKKLANIKGNVSLPHKKHKNASATPENKYRNKNIFTKSPLKNYQNLSYINRELEQDKLDLNINNNEVQDFADLLNQNINEEIDLLNLEEEILLKMKNELHTKESESNSLNESQSSRSMTPMMVKNQSKESKSNKSKATTEVSPFVLKTKEIKSKTIQIIKRKIK